ncbi:hypothetical protein, partial [Nocardioides sp. GY 10113]|uniref:hypothetical protein n=1 Tax=Nocardioides sp. GY 10113 TaxID=2569761 RepID=UPI001981A875
YDGTAPGAGWNDIGGDVGSWSTGDAILGFPASGVTTYIDTFASTTNRALAAYFQKEVTIPDASQVASLHLSGLANDGVVVYVNGVEVIRENMRTGTITPNSYADSARNATTAANNPFEVDVPPSLLVDGINVVAAETHLNYRASRDMGFDLSAELTTLE